MDIQNLIEKWELEISKVAPKEYEGGKWYDHEWSNGRYGAISEFLEDIKKLNLPIDRHHPIKFGRWLLKYAKEGWVEGTLCWQYEGKFYNTDELYNEFCRRES